jgi:hypothetical protein
MIDYDTPDEDPIVSEVRRIREEHAAQFNFDPRAIMEDYQRRQATSGRHYVSLPPRRPSGWTELAKKVG